MKTLKAFKYILMALIVLGCFASFAQNQYGEVIAVFALTALVLVFLTDMVYFIKKEKPLIAKENRNRKLIFYPAITAILTVVIAIILSSFLHFPWLVFISICILFTSLTILVIYLSHIKPLFIESLLFFLYSTGILFKLNHWPFSMELTTIATVFLLGYFISGTVIYFRNEKGQNISAAWFLLAVFLFFILNLAGTLFKTMHWPLGNMFGYIASVLFLFIFAFLVIRKQFHYPGVKISSWKLMGKIKGNFILIFIFYSLATVYFVLAMLNVVPKFYSNSKPYAITIFLENPQNSEAKYVYFNDTYNSFLEHRKGNKNREK